MQLHPARRLLGALAPIPLVVSACLGTSATPSPSAAGASPSAAASSASESAAASADITGTVTFWNGYAADGDEIKTFTETVVPAFNKLYPNITVNHQEIPYDDLRQKLVTGLAGGTLPDVLRADIIWVPEFADQDALLALDTEMSDFATISSQVFPGPLSTNKWKDHYYGLPLDTNTRILFYNTKVFADAGITAAPKTVDEFEAAMAQVKTKLGADHYGYAEGGTGPWSVLPWIWSFGGGITNADLTAATGTLNGPGTVAAITKLKEWLDKGYISPSILGGGVATSDQFGKDETATILEGPWMPGIFKNQFPSLGFQYATVPAGPGGSQSVVGGEDIVVFKQTANKEAALAFTRFMLSEEAQLAMGKVGQMPVLSSLSGNAELPDYYPTFQEQLKTANARTPVPAWPKIDEAISNAVLKALRGDAPIQKALDDAATAVDALLKGG
ncbi:MAG TPA: extracellular solute-binding protein [Candidatus Limnocylindrales bacterium]|jgi:multiple sugar transport system substrate-binding protein|nr:extracellular solute-binding protein [Candidatus Limnocylindrales bacterium]